MLGVSSFVSLAPVFLFATLSGTLADRARRHRIIVVTQSLSMVLPLILAALTFSGIVRVWHVLVLATRVVRRGADSFSLSRTFRCRPCC